MSAKLVTLNILKIKIFEIKVITFEILFMKEPTNFYHMNQTIFYMWYCDQSLLTLAFLWEKLSQQPLYKNFTRKNNFCDRCSWFKFNNLVVAWDMALTFYSSVAKRPKPKIEKFLGLIPKFVEVTGKKLVVSTKSNSTVLSQVTEISLTFNKFH